MLTAPVFDVFKLNKPRMINEYRLILNKNFTNQFWEHKNNNYVVVTVILC